MRRLPRWHALFDDTHKSNRLATDLVAPFPNFSHCATAAMFSDTTIKCSWRCRSSSHSRCSDMLFSLGEVGVLMCGMPTLACSFSPSRPPPVSSAYSPNLSAMRICRRADRLVCLLQPFLAGQVPSSMLSMGRMRVARYGLGSGAPDVQSDHVILSYDLCGRPSLGRSADRFCVSSRLLSEPEQGHPPRAARQAIGRRLCGHPAPRWCRRRRLRGRRRRLCVAAVARGSARARGGDTATTAASPVAARAPGKCRAAVRTPQATLACARASYGWRE